MGTNLTFPTGSPQGIRFVLVDSRVPYLTLLWWWLHLTLLRWRRWLHLTLLWRLRPLRRLFLLFLFRLWCLGDHKHTSEWRGECWTKPNATVPKIKPTSSRSFVLDIRRRFYRGVKLRRPQRTKVSQLGQGCTTTTLSVITTNYGKSGANS